MRLLLDLDLMPQERPAIGKLVAEEEKKHQMQQSPAKRRGPF
jgi:hypothetical protein